MAEATFHMKKGTEFPDSFAGAAIRHFSPDKPTSETDWATVERALRECYTDALSAHAGLTASYNLDRQKDIKSTAAETIGEGDTKRHRTVEELQTYALDEKNQRIKRRLRGEGGGSTKPASGKIKTKAVKDDIEEQLAAPDLDPAVRAYLEGRKARLEALGVAPATEATNGNTTESAPAPVETATKPAKGKNK